MEFQQRLSVLVFDLRPDLRVEFGCVEPTGGLGHRLEGVVDRVHDAVLAERVQCAAQRLVGERAGGRDPDVAPDQLRRRQFGSVISERAGPLIQAPQEERQRLAHVPQDDPHPREPVEHPAEYQAQRVRRGLGRPAPRRPAQLGAASLAGWQRRGVSGVQVDRDKTGVLLVTAAAGGVGSMVTQLAGALTSLTVVGTASLARVRCRCRLSMASSIWSLVPK
jgi:hypothetical protein